MVQGERPSRRTVVRAAASLGMAAPAAAVSACQDAPPATSTTQPVATSATTTSATATSATATASDGGGMSAIEAVPQPALRAIALDIPRSVRVDDLREVLSVAPAVIRAAAGEYDAHILLGLGSALPERFPSMGYPYGLIEMPAFAGDRIDPARSGGDLLVTVSATDDASARRAADTVLATLAPVVDERWRQAAAHDKIAAGQTGRNPLGFRDGSANPQPGTEAFTEAVYVDRADPPWLTGGSFLVVRRFRLDVDAFDKRSIADQERIIGRRKTSGAPLGGGTERDAVSAPVAGVIADPRSHARLANASANMGSTLLRRSYNSSEDDSPGLFFQAFVRDPVWQFVPIQHRLADSDLLNPFITAVGGGIWAVPRPDQLGKVV